MKLSLVFVLATLAFAEALPKLDDFQQALNLLKKLKQRTTSIKSTTQRSETKSSEEPVHHEYHNKQEEDMKRLIEDFKQLFDDAQKENDCALPHANSSQLLDANDNKAVSGENLRNAIIGVKDFVVDTKADFELYKLNAAPLEARLKAYQNDPSIQDEFLRKDHLNLAKNISRDMEKIGRNGFCQYVKLMPVLGRLAIYGVEDVRRCDAMIHTLKEHALKHGMDETKEVCHLDSLYMSLGDAFHNDIQCMSADINELHDMMEWAMGELKNVTVHSKSTIIMAIAAGKAKVTHIYKDGEMVKRSIDHIVKIAEQYDELKNQGESVFKEKCPDVEYHKKRQSTDLATKEDLKTLAKLLRALSRRK